MNKKLMNMALGLGACVCLFSGELSAWERSAMSDCKQDESDCKKEAKGCTDDKGTCKKQAEQCKKDAEACKKSAQISDETSFMNALSPYSKSQFQKFSPDQKKKAMDMADGAKISPDDAVTKVMKK